ncbi:uncharacterized protein PAC_03979 [Phialocephala subalpina]|uniref:Uncharacterized protein n=1 Tax=Phialocephala subalpina TaxID=576137 RepID=A0A1L7WMW7_9HELO|nr:uncharacterized protein PAC_03979 [Phialocephala subalpina]
MKPKTCYTKLFSYTPRCLVQKQKVTPDVKKLLAEGPTKKASGTLLEGKRPSLEENLGKGNAKDNALPEGYKESPRTEDPTLAMRSRNSS